MKKAIPYLFITIVILIFFSRLFFPKLGVFVTPDFGQSDLLHGYYPIKNEISKSFSNNEIPLWTKLEANGYPLIADGQIGYFSIYNLVLFRLFPFPLALDLLFISLFITIAFGTYLYALELGLSRIIGVFVSLTFALSGFHIMQITHISLLHAIAFFPLEMYVVEKLLKRIRLPAILFLSLVLSQQILAGHQQMTVYSLIGLYSYVTLRSFLNGKHFRMNLRQFALQTFLFGISVVIALFLSAVQLFPSIELFKNSVLLSGKSSIDLFPYPLKHLLSFINPFYFGSPRNATYPMFNTDWGIFWENTAYVGLVPIILLPFSLFLKRKASFSLIVIFIFLGGTSLLFVLGKYSPFYFLFEFPPLSSFRVASRFLFITAFSLTFIAGLILQEVKNKYLVLTFIFFQLCLFFYYFFYYHPILGVNEVFKRPEILNNLKLDQTQERIYTFGDSQRWNDIFLTEGWKKPDKYMSFMNNLHLHTNLYINYPKSNPEVKFISKRKDVFNHFLNLSGGTISSEAGRLLGLQAVKFVISPAEKKISDWKKIEGTKYYGIYENPYYSPRAKMIYEYKTVSTLQDLTKGLNEADSYAKVALTEKKLERESPLCTQNCNYSVNWMKDKNNEAILTVKTESDGIFVLADSYDTGWKATVDGKNVEIFPVNIDQRGLLLEKGTHTIIFRYQPRSFYLGLLLTIISHIVVVFLLIKR